MKTYHKLIIVIAMITSLAGCGNANEPIVEQNSVQHETVADIEVEETETVDSTVVIDTPDEAEDSVEINEYSGLDTLTGMVANSDGTYTFTEEFIGTITSYDYLDGATEEEVNDFLNFIAPMIEGLDGQGVNDFMAMFTGNLHQENVTIAESITGEPQSQGGQTQSSGNQTQSNQSNSGNSNSGNNNNNAGNSNNRPPETTDDSIWEGDGTFTFSDEQIGGGPHTELTQEEIEAFIKSNS